MNQQSTEDFQGSETILYDTEMVNICHYPCVKTHEIQNTKSEHKDFPGSPMVKTSPSNAGGVYLIPGQEAKIPHAEWHGKTKQNKTKKQQQ